MSVAKRSGRRLRAGCSARPRQSFSLDVSRHPVLCRCPQHTQPFDAGQGPPLDRGSRIASLQFDGSCTTNVSDRSFFDKVSDRRELTNASRAIARIRLAAQPPCVRMNLKVAWKAQPARENVLMASASDRGAERSEPQHGRSGHAERKPDPRIPNLPAKQGAQTDESRQPRLESADPGQDQDWVDRLLENYD